MPQQPEIQNKSSNDQLLEVAKKLLEQSGIDPNDFDAAISALNIAKQQAPNNHHHGGTVIGRGDKGVVNENLKVNNINNLYVAGSSVFPNSSI